MADAPTMLAAIPYVFCADPGAVADWCVRTLGLGERERWTDDDGVEVDPPRTRGHGVRELGVTDPEGHVWGFVQCLG